MLELYDSDSENTAQQLLSFESSSNSGCGQDENLKPPVNGKEGYTLEDEVAFYDKLASALDDLDTGHLKMDDFDESHSKLTYDKPESKRLSSQRNNIDSRQLQTADEEKISSLIPENLNQQLKERRETVKNFEQSSNNNSVTEHNEFGNLSSGRNLHSKSKALWTEELLPYKTVPTPPLPPDLPDENITNTHNEIERNKVQSSHVIGKGGSHPARVNVVDLRASQLISRRKELKTHTVNSDSEGRSYFTVTVVFLSFYL